MPKQNPLFIKLDDPLYLKKIVLESAISSVLLQKDYERVKQAEKQVNHLTFAFIAKLKEIERQISQLESFMPKLDNQPSRPSMLPVEATNYIESQEDSQEYTPELASLEDELRDIEAKLNSI